MTRNDIKAKFNILGENKDLMLFHKNKPNCMGIGYCGNIELKHGKAIFNGESFSNVDSLYEAVVKWGETLEYPVDTYCPMYNEGARVESRIVWYLTDKLGFKRTDKNYRVFYIKSIGDSFRFEFYVNRSIKDDSKVDITSKCGEYTFYISTDNAHEGIASINTIVDCSVLGMAKDMVDIISLCANKTIAPEIDAYIPSTKSFLGVEKVSFKDMMITKLEEQLKLLKET